jgi:iron complex transport system ATP-binding protein
VTAALTLENVSAGYAGRPALHSMTASFEAGRVTGLVGANGAGKTTLLRLAAGILSPTEGCVRVLGRPRAHASREALARAIAYLPQGAEPQWPVEARTLVALGRLPHHSALRPPRQVDWNAIDIALARCHAGEFATRRVDRLSAGERARVLLARALATAAPILLADEPAAHLDPAHQLMLMELLREEAQRGAAVVVTLHELSLAQRFCDEVLVLKDGAVLARGAPAEALSDEFLAAAFGVRALKPSAGQSFPIIPWQRV